MNHHYKRAKAPNDRPGKRYTYEHILIAEKALGHYLPKTAEVHHIDGDVTNNANTNLVICENRKYHRLLHYRQKILALGGDPNTQRFCPTCRTMLPLSAFCKWSKYHGGLNWRCRNCYMAWKRAW